MQTKYEIMQPLNQERFDMIIGQRKHQLFAIADVQKIQYEKFHPIKTKEYFRTSDQGERVHLTLDAIISMRFKTAMRAVTSLGAIVLIADGDGDPLNDVCGC